MQITRQTLFPLAFYKKSKFNGSKGNWNYRIEKATEGDEDIFLLSVWKGPYCYEATKEEKQTLRYPFNEEGMEEIVAYLNQI